MYFESFQMSKHTVSSAQCPSLVRPFAQTTMLLKQQLVSSAVPNAGRLNTTPRMKFFSAKAFEHLLFELHRSVYVEIDRQLQLQEQRFPGYMASLCEIFAVNFTSAPSQGVAIEKSALVHGCPAFDVCIQLTESEMKKARKCVGAKVCLLPSLTRLDNQRENGHHLIVGLKGSKESFIVPLPLVLMAFEDRVCKSGTYQVYEHTLIRKTSTGLVTTENYMNGAGQYVGITSRTWQQRAKEHAHAARRGSYLLFHRAMRGDLFDVDQHEHIVARAGLSRSQALQVEEIEVEARTLRDTHPNGLNMIPGGEAGLRFLSSMSKRAASSIDLEKVDDLLEAEINRSLRQPGLRVKGAHSNEKLAALWKTDIDFRIRTMTGQAKRLSYRQIRNARIWHAAGWLLEKILLTLNGMDDRVVTQEQLERLLSGKTYESIPHVLVNY